MKHNDSKISFNPDTSATKSDSTLRVDSGNVRGSASSIRYEDESDYAPREFLENRLGRSDSLTEEAKAEDGLDELSHELSASGLTQSSSPIQMKIGKAKQKRAKKAQLAAEKSQSIECTICNASFSSRNRLFSHIKSNHAQH
jgi:DnaJ family protein A protein 5